MSGGILEVRDVAVRYGGRTVLEVPRLAVRPGEVLTLVGENGSGKTTLLRLLGLLVQPDRGRVTFGGEDVDFGDSRRLLELRRRTAAVMQEPLLCRMSVRRNVALGLRFRGLARAEVENRTGVWLDRLSISHLGDRPASNLSGGEAQRASLARAMAINPEVLLLDEPFAALDAPTRHTLLDEFRAVLADFGGTAVFATHDRGEALRLGDRVAVLLRGRIAQVGPSEDVFLRPAQVEVARFLGVETLIPGRVTSTVGRRAQVACGAIRIEAGGAGVPGEEVVVAVRSEEIEIFGEDGPAVRDGEASGAVNRLRGRVTAAIPTETHYRVEIDGGARLVAVASRRKVRELAIEPGRPVVATFPPSAAHLIRHGGGSTGYVSAEVSDRDRRES